MIEGKANDTRASLIFGTGSQPRELLPETINDIVGRVDEAIVFDGMNPDTPLFKAVQMVSQKKLLGPAPLVELGVLLHPSPLLGPVKNMTGKQTITRRVFVM